MKKTNKGFTLIELLVVIAIIGLLSTMAVVALNNARQKARDAKRVSDIKQIQTALELFYNDASSYPTSANVAEGDPVEYLGTTYMAIVPSNPTPNGQAYTYAAVGAGWPDYTSYTLQYELEGKTGDIDPGVNTASPNGIK
jgi:general secretion pathway protein G